MYKDLEVDGLENVLVNDVILSRQWKLEQVWRWQKPAHINIQETMAAERLFKQEAASRPKTRFPLFMDSNVSLSALVKGRSPSKGLRKCLRRAGATLIAGCLYPSGCSILPFISGLPRFYLLIIPPETMSFLNLAVAVCLRKALSMISWVSAVSGH